MGLFCPSTPLLKSEKYSSVWQNPINSNGEQLASLTQSYIQTWTEKKVVL